MKNVFLIGNGFDLHHKLPTKYFDFLCVAKYLTTSGIFFPLTIGRVFSECSENPNLKKCYEEHNDIYDSIEIDSSKVQELTDLLRYNKWFWYFIEILDMDLGWIDFEKQISIVIDNLDKLISSEDNEIYLASTDIIPAFILNHFKYFIDIDDKYEICGGETHTIKTEYLKEYIHTSKIYVADKKKIFEQLYDDLIKLRNALNIYLECFVENTINSILKSSIDCKIKLIDYADSILSFNYTSTLESFYMKENIHHIHGTVQSKNIVLGVNPSESDDSGTDNTSLIKFKKYYQREFFCTNNDYINWYRETIAENNDYRVITIGHSLDITDKDILSDVFLNAKEIYLTYYNDDCKSDYFENMVKMFGNGVLDKFFKEKKLQFVPLSKIDSLSETFMPEILKYSVITL